MPAVNRSQQPDEPSAEATDTGAEAAETTPANPLEAIRRAQANRSLPPSHGGRGGGGVGKGSNPKAPRMYNRHK